VIPTDDWPERYHQVYFRTSKGGVGVGYNNALAEFRAVFGATETTILKELPGRARIVVQLGVDEARMAALAGRLGYTLGIVRLTRHPLAGRAERLRMDGRWPIGWLREGDSELLFEPVFAASEEERLAASPHRLEFPQIVDDGPERSVRGRRVNRRLSPLDARFSANVCGLEDGTRVLDPFSGLCVLADALVRRDLRVLVGDIDSSLRPGMAARHPGGAAILDATKLPFADGALDGVVTEPPYHPADRHAVIAAIPELARVTRPGGRVALLVAEHMLPEVEPVWRRPSLAEEARYTIQRHGLRSTLVVLAVG